MPNSHSVLTPEAAAAWRDELQREGRRLVFTSGCFDVLHAGHVRYLQQARDLGDALVVALNSDASVRSLKGPDRPLNSEADRAEVLLALKSVDAAVIFDDLRTTSLLRAIRPHVFAKGGDYTMESLNPEERGALEEIGAQIEILPEVKGKSTTATLEKMRGAPKRLRLGVMGSGQGTNFQALVDAIAAGTLDVEIALVISDVEGAPILDRAQKAGIPAVHVTPGGEKWLDAAAQKEVCDRMRAAGADYIFLAGFMRVLKEPLLGAYPRRILNIHPSLLPKYPGLRAIPRALEAGETETGCTVHLVDGGVDSGEILAQRTVPILPEDTVEMLTRRVQLAEHELIVECVRGLAQGSAGMIGSATELEAERPTTASDLAGPS